MSKTIDPRETELLQQACDLRDSYMLWYMQRGYPGHLIIFQIRAEVQLVTGIDLPRYDGGPVQARRIGGSGPR